MTTANDLPTDLDAWTLSNLQSAVAACIASGTTPPQILRCFLSSSRHQAEIAPADGEQWDFMLQDVDLNITHHAPIDQTFDIPAPTLTVVDKPRESPTFDIPAPTFTPGNMTGPVTAQFTVPVPTLTATTVRRYNRDELFGFISDDGRRIGKVV